jgi:LemA protein
MNLFLFIVILAGVILLYLWNVYNKFVTIKTRIGASIQEIGNQLKRQADLVPNLVEAVKGHMEHEKTVFDKLTEARKAVMGVLESGDAQRLVEAGAKLEQAFAPIRAVFESTPQLQAASPTVKLMDELRDTADKLMYSRRTLIDLTADYNVMLVAFPSNFIGRLFNFKPQPGLRMAEGGEFLQVSEKETKTPEVKLT